MEQLKNQVAVVTGGTAGIGRAIAMRLARAGARVAILGRNRERGESVVREICAAAGDEGRARFDEVDVASTADVERVLKGLQGEWGGVNILVNNAGITRDALLMRMTEEQWDSVLDTNLKGAYNTSRVLIRSMMKAGGGRIINISSVVGLTGNAGQAHYAASKSGLIGLSKALAKELSSRHINVNVIAPGFIDTEMTGVLSQEIREGILKAIPLGRMGKPEDIAEAALFLAGPGSDYITGQVITVDGGMVM